MKKLFLLITMLFVLISFSSSWASPKISVEKDTFEFDSVPEGTIVKHGFILKNIGDETLLITKILTG